MIITPFAAMQKRVSDRVAVEAVLLLVSEEGPHAGRGVVERMSVIGQQITHADETVSARAAAVLHRPSDNLASDGVTDCWSTRRTK